MAKINTRTANRSNTVMRTLTNSNNLNENYLIL